METEEKIKDNGFKKIFGNKQLFCEFIKSFIDIDILKDITPDDIEDISERFITSYKENRDSDTVKKIKLKEHESFFVICLIEHQSKVHYLMSFRILEYIVLIWKDYIEKIDIENNNTTPSKKKDFKLPPILPIVFYEGTGNWTAETQFKDKVLFNDIFEKYIPKFEYEVVNLNKYGKEDLLSLNNLLSLILLIDKVKSPEDFSLLKDLPKHILENIANDTSSELLKVLADIATGFLEKANVPQQEIESITEKIYKRRFVEMFTLIEEYDVQATRREARQEGLEKGIKEGLDKGIKEGKISNARNFLSMGFSIEQVAKGTELSIEQVKKIQEELKTSQQI